jgi:hypothetical protein
MTPKPMVCVSHHAIAASSSAGSIDAAGEL